jgi:surfactin synthase thioesterase subunit
MVAAERQNSRPRNAGLAVESPYIWRARRADCRHRLICFPHSGGGAGVFAGWLDSLPPEIELTAMQLPGRQNRIHEELPTEAGPLIRSVTQALRPLLTGPRFSFFGHSCGALLAFEVARALQVRGGPTPVHLFVSGQASPEAAKQGPELHRLSEEDFRTEVLGLGGFDEEVAADDEVMEALLPVVLADFRLWERHPIAPVPRLNAPITAFTGQADHRAPLKSIEGWRAHTNAAFETRLFPGGHFYLFDSDANVELPEFIANTLLKA